MSSTQNLMEIPCVDQCLQRERLWYTKTSLLDIYFDVLHEENLKKFDDPFDCC